MRRRTSSGDWGCRDQHYDNLVGKQRKERGGVAIRVRARLGFGERRNSVYCYFLDFLNAFFF